jgi:hypothetical protein
MALAVEPFPIECGDTTGFLTTMLQSVQTKRDKERSLRVTEDANDAAFFARFIVIMVKDHSTNPHGLFVRGLF